VIADIAGLREAVRALRVPRGLLFHDPLRWRLFQAPGDLPEEKLRRFLVQNGLHAAAPQPERKPRLRQVFWVAPDQIPSRELRIHARARFACVACGVSCHMKKLGPLLREDVARLQALDWSGTGRDPSAFYIEEDGSPLDAGTLAERWKDPFLRRENDACQFLRDDNLCEVHARFGAAAKPLMCRMFPYQYRATPTGIAVGMRLGECASMLAATRGLPVVDQHDDLLGMLAQHESIALLPPTVWSTQDSLLTWEEYQRIEGALLAGASLPAGGSAAPFAGAVFRAFEPQAGEPGSEADLAEMARRAREGLPPVSVRPLDPDALLLEDRLCRQALFNKDLFLHQDLAQAAALLVLRSYLCRLDAPDGTAQGLNLAWKAAASRQLRELCADLDVRGLAVRALDS
jgi:Fe-S-cluster containining protein